MKSIRSKATLELGTRLVEELGCQQSTDTLSRWMAHHIAEMIQSAENATGNNRCELMKQCEEAILRLWKHRYEFPSTKNPLMSLEELESTLQSLDIHNNRPRYFRDVWETRDESEADTDETKNWLLFAKRLDDSAKSLIRFALTQGAEASLDQSRPWIQLLKSMDAPIENIQVIFESFDTEEKMLTGNADHCFAKKELKSRIQSLDQFIEIANLVREQFVQTLAAYDEQTSGDRIVKEEE